MQIYFDVKIAGFILVAMATANISRKISTKEVLVGSILISTTKEPGVYCTGIVELRYTTEGVVSGEPEIRQCDKLYY